MTIPSLQKSLNGRDEMAPAAISSLMDIPRLVPQGICGPEVADFRMRSRKAGAFTLVELLVSTAIIALIMLMLVQVTNNISTAWRTTAEKVEKFQGARDGFEAMTRRISQATLNTYWDYYDVSGITRNQSAAPGSFLPFSYGRQSDLRFISGPMSGVAWSITAGTGMPPGELTYMPTHGIFFQAPLGVVGYANRPIYGALDNLLNTWGYFVEINSDTDPRINMRPTFLSGVPSAPPLRWRGRLMEFQEPSENMLAYDVSALPTSANKRDWFVNSLKITDATRPARVLAENVIALIILPKLSAVDEAARELKLWSLLCPEYTYDSTLLPTGAAGTPPSLTTGPINPGAWVSSASDGSDAGGIDPRNQLPPIVQVVMIAIDERSAQRLIDLTNPGAGAAGAVNLADPSLGGLYTGGSLDGNPLFTTALAGKSKYVDQLGNAEKDPGTSTPTDLYTFTQALVAKKLTYRVFSTNVTIRGAKWSRAQAN